MITTSFDLFGNIYFTSNNKTYQLSVNGRNQLHLDEGEYKILETKNILNRLNLISNKNGLHDMIEKEKEIDLDDIDEGDENENENEEEEKEDNEIDDEDYVNDLEYEKYCPEDSEYLQPNILEDDLIDEDNIKTFGEDNKPFHFSSNSELFEIHNRELGDVSALYDTYIYDNGLLSFISVSPLKNSSYRLRIVDISNNTIILFFRPIGSVEKNI